MALSSVTWDGAAGTQTYSVPFPYLVKSHVQVTVNGSAAGVTYTWPSSSTITLTTPTIVDGDTITFRRVTPNTDAGLLVSPVDGGVLTAAQLRTSQRQLLYVAQEVSDASGGMGVADDDPNAWEAVARRIRNLGAPQNANDAVRLIDLQSVVTSEGNLPVVSTANNDAGLFVNAGEWSVRTPAEVRAHLALGAAAQLAPGTATGNLVQLAAPSATLAKLPVVDGRDVNLDAHPKIVALSKKPAHVRIQMGNATGDGYQVLNSTAANWFTDTNSLVQMTAVGSLNNPLNSIFAVQGGGFRVEVGDVSSTTTQTFRVSVVLMVENRNTSNKACIDWGIGQSDTSENLMFFVSTKDTAIPPALDASHGSVITLATERIMSIPAGQRYQVGLKLRNNVVSGGDCRIHSGRGVGHLYIEQLFS